MKRILLLAVTILFPCLCGALDWSLSVRVDERSSFLQSGDAGKLVSDYTNLDIQGSLDNRLSFRFRNRTNTLVRRGDFLTATDIMYLDYKVGSWEFLGGKFQQEYGGFEYDDNIVDLYFCGVYYDNFVGAFNYCANVSRLFPSGKLTFQFAKSPFSDRWTPDLYAYNLGYRGTHGIWSSKWSVNLFDTPMEWRTAHLALGNSFAFGPMTLQLDYITRTDLRDFRPFVDWSLVGKLLFSLGGHIDLFAKVNLDVNPSVEDLFVPMGTDCCGWGGGIELFPNGNRRDVRFHLVYCNNGVSNISAGVTWKMQMFKH